MRKLLLIPVAVLLFGLVAAPFAALAAEKGSPQVAAKGNPQTVTLGVNLIFPATHFVASEQLPRYFKKVEAATGNKYRLNIQYYPVGTLLTPGDAYDGMTQGIVDMVQSCFSYTPGRFPVMWSLYKPGIAPPENCDAAAHAIWEYYNTLKPKELGDSKVLYLWAVGPGWLHTKQPVTTVADIKGLKIRSTGAFTDAVKLLGGEPIAMPMGDVYLAAQKGLIDSLISPPETLETWKHHELFDYSVFLPTVYSHFQYLVINLNKWNGLPKDLQDAFDAVAKDAVKEAGQIWQYNNQKGIDYAKAQRGGHHFSSFSDSELAKLLDAIKPIRDSYVEELNRRGLDGEHIVKTAVSTMEKYNKQTFEPWKP
jgi:TRAP-type transport system periplasmic protein